MQTHLIGGVNSRRRHPLPRSVPFDFQTNEIIDLMNSLYILLLVKARKKEKKIAFHAAMYNPSSTTDAYI